MSVSSGTSPSKGQPKAAEIVTVTRTPSAAARARDPRDSLDGLGDRHALVALAEGLGRDDDGVHLADPGGERAVVAALVEDEGRVD